MLPEKNIQELYRTYTVVGVCVGWGEGGEEEGWGGGEEEVEEDNQQTRGETSHARVNVISMKNPKNTKDGQKNKWGRI